MNKTTTYTLIGAIVLIIIAGALWNYAGEKKPVVTEPTEVTLMFGFTPNVGYAPFYVAAANDYYANENLDVSFQYSAEGGAGVAKQIVAGNVEFGYAGDNEVIMSRLRDISLVNIQRIIQKNLFGIYSKENLGITASKNLAGKKIALPGPASSITTITKLILGQSNIDFTQIEPLYVGGALISTHLAGNADAFGAYLPQKVVAEAIDGNKMNEISASDYTTIGRTYVFTSDTMVNEYSDIVTKFVRATQKGLEYSIVNPEAATDAYIRYNPEAVEKRGLHLSIWKAMAEQGFDRDANGKPIFHLPSEDNWTEKQNQMFDVGAIDKKTDVSKMYTDEFLPTN